jgi:hypothetical protein
MYNSYSFLTSALDGVIGQRHAPAALYSQERTPGTHWTGGWVGPRAGLDTQTTCLCRGSNPGRLVDRCVNNQNIGMTLQVVTCLVCQPCANRSLGLIETSHIKESRLIVLEEGRMCVLIAWLASGGFGVTMALTGLGSHF